MAYYDPDCHPSSRYCPLEQWMLTFWFLCIAVSSITPHPEDHRSPESELLNQTPSIGILRPTRALVVDPCSESGYPQGLDWEALAMFGVLVGYERVRDVG